MNNNFKYAVAFVSGAAIGSVVTWRLLKSKYERLTREGIESYKEAIAKQGKDDCSEPVIDADEATEHTQTDKLPSPEDVEVADEYAAKLKILGYTAEEPDVEIAIPEDECDENEEEEEEEYEPSRPFVIEPVEYGEKDDYGYENLTFYADGVLADSMEQPIEDIYGVVGNALTHFGDYEDNVVHVRNDRLKCDYEVLRDPRAYSECMAQKVPYKPEE